MLRYDFPLVALGGLSASAASTASDKLPMNGAMSKRVYFCQRCLNHGLTEPRKNHKCECAYANCTCDKCILVEKRRVLNTQLHELEEVGEPENDNDSEEQNSDSNSNGSRVKGERVPNCQKCGQHGRKSRLKGHKRSCPFRDCNCPKCQVVSERQKLMADQIKIRRRQRKDSMMNLTRERLAQTINAVNAISNATTAGTLPYLSSINMIYKQLSQVQPQVSSAAAFIASPSPASTTADTPSFSYPFNPTPPDMLKMAATPTALPQLPLLFSTPQTASAPTVTSVPASSPELQQQQLILPGSTPSPMSPVSPTVTVSSLLDSIAAPIAIHPSLQTQSQNEQLLSFLTQMRLLDPKLCMPASAFDLLQAVTSAAAPLSDVAEPVSTAPSAFVDVCTV